MCPCVFAKYDGSLWCVYSASRMTTNLHFHLKNSLRAQFQALHQVVKTKESNASTNNHCDTIAITTIWSW